MYKKIIVATIILCSGLNSNAQSAPGNSLFGDPVVHDFDFYISIPDFWDSLTYYHSQIAITGVKQYIKCDSLLVDGITYIDVGLRCKGNSAYSYAYNFPSVKLPFKVDFDKYVVGQKCDGIKKINLHNEDRDPTILRSKIQADFMNTHSVLSPRYGFTRVSINGVYWGLYTLVEQLDKTFLSAYFSNNGNLFKARPRFLGWEGAGGANLDYLGSSPILYDSIYRLKTNTTANDWSDFVYLLNIINNTPASEFQDSLDKYMWVDSYLEAWAALTIFTSFDSYPQLGNNFYLYQNPASGKFHWIAWDFNLGIGTLRWGLTIPQAETASIYWWDGVPAPFGVKIMDNPYYMNRYLAFVCEMMQDLQDVSAFNTYVDSLATAIRPDVYADPNKFYSNLEFDENMVATITGKPGVKTYMNNRIAAIQAELLLEGCTQLSIEEESPAQSILVYPNPTNGITTFYFDNFEGRELYLEFYAISGQKLLESPKTVSNTLQVGLDSFENGLYIYRILSKDFETIEGKLVVSD